MRKLVVLSVLALLVLVPAAALAAKTVRHEGTFVDDPAAKVNLKVRKSHGEVLKVAGFRARNVRTNCPRGRARFDFRIRGGIKVNEKNHFRAKATSDNGAVQRITGRVKGNGKAVVGNFRANGLRSNNGQKCYTPKQRFKTNRV